MEFRPNSLSVLAEGIRVGLRSCFSSDDRSCLSSLCGWKSNFIRLCQGKISNIKLFVVCQGIPMALGFSKMSLFRIDGEIIFTFSG